MIKSVLTGKPYQPKYGEGAARATDQELIDRWRTIGDHCSACERRADEASRDVEAWLKCQFMKDRVGEQLPGTVTGVAPFGLFVTLDSLYVEGLIHVSELGGEYFQHNDVIHELRGERTGRRFRLYDPLVVQISRVDLDARRIEFRLVPSMVRAVKRSKLVSDEDLSNEALLGDEATEALGLVEARPSPRSKSARGAKGSKGVRAAATASKSKPTQAKAAHPKAAKAGKRTGRKRRG